MTFQYLYKREIEVIEAEIKKELRYFNDTRIRKLAINICKQLFGKNDKGPFIYTPEQKEEILERLRDVGAIE